MTTIALPTSTLAFPANFVFFPDQNIKRRSAVEPATLSQKSFLPQFFLVGEIVPGWEVIQPIALDIQHDEDGSVLVSDDSFYTYGCGETVQAATHDYAVSLSEYYKILSSHDDRPSQALFNLLRQYLRPI